VISNDIPIRYLFIIFIKTPIVTYIYENKVMKWKLLKRVMMILLNTFSYIEVYKYFFLLY